MRRLWFLLALGCAGCGGGESAGVDASPAPVDAAAEGADAAPPDAAPPDATAVSTYADDILPIWQNRCIPCHFGDEPSFPELAMGRAALVEQPSRQAPEFDLVAPGEPDESYLWLKLNNLHTELNNTDPMPQPNQGGAFEPIPASERARVEGWIASGAGDTWQ